MTQYHDGKPLADYADQPNRCTDVRDGVRCSGVAQPGNSKCDECNALDVDEILSNLVVSELPEDSAELQNS